MSQQDSFSYLVQPEEATPASRPGEWKESTFPVKEETRRLIATTPLAGYLLLVVGILAWDALSNANEADGKDLITLLITSYTTLIVSAMGYYFGRQEACIK